MEISQIVLIKLLLYSVIWGAITGLAFNINNAIRCFFEIDGEKHTGYLINKCQLKIFRNEKQKKNKSHVNNIVVIAQDFIISFIYILGLVFINFSINKGSMRLFTVFVSFFSLIIYKFTIGRLIQNLLNWLLFKIKKAIIAILSLIYIPIVYFSTKICKICNKIYVFFKNSIAKWIKKRYNNYKEKYLSKIAGTAFLNVSDFLK